MSQRGSPARSLFWPGFALGFLLLASISCGGLVAALGFSDLSLSDLQIGAPVWTPPPVAPTPQGVSASSQSSGEQFPTTTALFQAGDSAYNAANSRVNIRRTPGYLGKPADDVLGQLQPGDEVVILDGVAAADNLNWWLIRAVDANGGGTEGWVAEATASGVVILR